MIVTNSNMEASMNTFINWTSQVAIASRIVEERREQDWNELRLLGDYHRLSARMKPAQKPQSGCVRFSVRFREIFLLTAP
jgi:hypothetical protein